MKFAPASSVPSGSPISLKFSSAFPTTEHSRRWRLYLQERLNFSTEQTGTLTGIFGGMVWFLAIFGGAAADRMGFRRALSIAYLILAAAYFLIGSIGAPWLAPMRNAVPLGLFVGLHSDSSCARHLAGEALRGRHHGPRIQGKRSLDRLFDLLHAWSTSAAPPGPIFASWAHRHLGVENVYRVAALSVFAMFFVVLFFFREPRQPGDAPPPSIATVARNFCVVVGNYRLVLPVLSDRPAAAHRTLAIPLHRALVDLGRTSVARARRNQPVHVVPRAVHRLLGRVLAAIHQSARIHSRIHQSAG